MKHNSKLAEKLFDDSACLAVISYYACKRLVADVEINFVGNAFFFKIFFELRGKSAEKPTDFGKSLRLISKPPLITV